MAWLPPSQQLKRDVTLSFPFLPYNIVSEAKPLASNADVLLNVAHEL